MTRAAGQAGRRPWPLQGMRSWQQLIAAAVTAVATVAAAAIGLLTVGGDGDAPTGAAPPPAGTTTPSGLGPFTGGGLPAGAEISITSVAEAEVTPAAAASSAPANGVQGAAGGPPGGPENAEPSRRYAFTGRARNIPTDWRIWVVGRPLDGGDAWAVSTGGAAPSADGTWSLRLYRAASTPVEWFVVAGPAPPSGPGCNSPFACPAGHGGGGAEGQLADEGTEADFVRFSARFQPA